MKRHLRCNCCGDYAGKWEQWHNRDTGWGICARCAKRQSSNIEELRFNCGVPDVNFDGSLLV